MTSKDKAIAEKEHRDRHFWEVVAQSDDATISVNDTADALGIPAGSIRKGMEDGNLSQIGYMAWSRSRASRNCVILRNLLIKWFQGI